MRPRPLSLHELQSRPAFAPSRLALPQPGVDFRIGRVVSVVAGTTENCQALVVGVRMLDADYDQTAGPQTVTNVTRRQTTYFAAAAGDAAPALEDLVGISRAPNGQWWVVENYGGCPVSPSSGSPGGGGGGGGDVPEICGCQTECWDLTISGWSNGTCTECADFNGTWRMQYEPDSGCQWNSVDVFEACTGGQFALIYDTGAAEWTLTTPDGATYVLSHASWNCGGANVLARDVNRPECAFSLSVTITGVEC